MPGDITDLLRQVRSGNRDAEQALFATVYHELHAMAARRFRSERREHTLQPTALVHEAYLRLLDEKGRTWTNRTHFFAVASRTMRHVLIDHARRQHADKRGAGQTFVELGGVALVPTVDLDNLLRVDNALRKLAECDERQSRIVEMRFFGGLTEEEVAEVLAISVRTVKREWAVAKAWLYAELAG